MEVKYIDHMGTDLSVCNSARVSFGKKSSFKFNTFPLDYEGNSTELIEFTKDKTGTLVYDTFQDMDYVTFNYLEDKDVKLISYLAKHKHWTPFSHTAITLHIKAPIFVRTQCFKHKVGFTENEISRRYVSDEPDYYVPKEWRGKAEDKKQGSSEALPEAFSVVSESTYMQSCISAVAAYNELLRLGVAPEQARMVLPQSTYTQWYWTGSLSAYARFYNLRSKPDAQKEIQELAEMIGDIIKPLYPVSWNALTNGEDSAT